MMRVLLVLAIAVAISALPHEKSSEIPDQLESRLEAENKQIAENMKFGQRVTERISVDDKELKHAEAAETLGIAEMHRVRKEAEQVVLGGSLTPELAKKGMADFTKTVSDAEGLTKKIDAEAKKVDDSLKRVKADMLAAKVPQRNAAVIKRLGEASEKDENSRAAEAKARSEEAKAASSVHDAKLKKQEHEARETLSQMSDYAAEGLKKLTAAEKILAPALAGHRDKALEYDVEAKLNDLRTRAGDNLGEAFSTKKSKKDAAVKHVTGATTTKGAPDPNKPNDSPASDNEGASANSVDSDASSTTATAGANESDGGSANDSNRKELGEVPTAPTAQLGQAEMADLSAMDTDIKELEQYEDAARSTIKEIRKELNY